MKKQFLNQQLSCVVRTNKTIFALACATLFSLISCEKQPNTIQQTSTAPIVPQASAQEQMLFGKWSLKKTETYEIDGVDSTGEYICDLIGVASTDSLCAIEFRNTLATSGPLQYNGLGTMGGCGSVQLFSWRATQQNIVELGDGSVYNLLYVSGDSAVFSNVYRSGVLMLKAVFRYKKK